MTQPRTDPDMWPIEDPDEDPVALPDDEPEQHRDHRDPGDRDRLRGHAPEWFRRLHDECTA